MTHFNLINKASEGFFAQKVDWKKQRGQSLPQDLLQEAANRLSVVALIYSATYFLAYFGSGLAGWMREDFIKEVFLTGTSQLAWLSILGSLVILGIARSGRLNPEQILDLGLAFLILGALGIAVPNFWGIFPEGPPDFANRHSFVGVPWEAVWILIFPVIIPNCPLKTLLASLVAASMGPLITSFSLWSGATSSDLSYGFFWQYFLFTNYLCALLAWFSSSYIHKLGSNLSRARDLGSYQLLSKLGIGGMGEVWLAEHRLLARSSALKLIKPEILGANQVARTEAMARFEREARVTASLSSPHTIRLFDFGRTPEGSFFYVMELLHGIGLGTLDSP